MFNGAYTQQQLFMGHIKAVFTNAKGQQKQRIEACRECASLNPRTMICMECGCVTILKASISTQECPLNKWNKEITP